MPRRTTGTTSSNEALYAFDTARRAEHGTVCGVDEAGRGARGGAGGGGGGGRAGAPPPPPPPHLSLFPIYLIFAFG